MNVVDSESAHPSEGQSLPQGQFPGLGEHRAGACLRTQGRFLRDGFGTLRRVDRPDGTFTINWTTWDDMLVPGHRTTSLHQLDSSGAATAVTVDHFGRPVRSWKTGLRGSILIADTEYFAFGGVRSVSPAQHFVTKQAPASPVAIFSYDGRRRKKTIRRPGSNSALGQLLGHDEVEHFKYGPRTVVRTDARRHSETVTFDAVGHAVRVLDPTLAETVRIYGPFDTLTEVRDAKGRTRSQVFDAYGRRRQLDDPDLGVQTVAYDAMDRLVRATDNSGRTTELCYDNLHRPTKRVSSDGVASWEYDGPNGVGLPRAATSEDSVRHVWAYDSVSRITSEQLGVDGETFELGYRYNTRGELGGVSYPGLWGRSLLTLRHSYDDFGNLTQLRDSDSGELLWDLDAEGPSGQVSSTHYGTQNLGASVTREYDALTGAVDSIVATEDGGRPVQDVSYGYDEKLNVTQVADPILGVTRQAEYDELDRLTSVTQGDGIVSMGLSYDEIGNIRSKTEERRTSSGSVITLLTPYTYAFDHDAVGPRPYTLTRMGSTEFSYDANGNQIRRRLSSGAVSEMGYTTRNMLRWASTPLGEYRYEYDSVDRRARRRGPAATTVYFGDLYEREVSSSGRVVHRLKVHASEGLFLIREAQTSPVVFVTDHYLHRGRDDSPNVVRSVDMNGTVKLERLNYDAFGRRSDLDGAPSTTDAPTSYGYTGHEAEDDLGLVNMRGRMYDPESGRFLSPDPYVWSTLDSQAGARYSYVRNNPLTYRDPTGFQSTGDPYEVVVRAKRLPSERPKVFDTQRRVELVPTPDVKGNRSILSGPFWRGFRQGAAPGIESVGLGAALALMPGAPEFYLCLAAASMVNEILPIVADHATGVIDDDEYSRRLGYVVGAATTGVAIGAVLAGARIAVEGVAREVLEHFFRPIPRAGVGELSLAESGEGSLSVAAGGAANGAPSEVFFHGARTADAEAIVSGGVKPVGQYDGEFFTVAAAEGENAVVAASHWPDRSATFRTIGPRF